MIFASFIIVIAAMAVMMFINKDEVKKLQADYQKTISDLRKENADLRERVEEQDRLLEQAQEALNT